jgi:hypothetical protein
MTQALQRIERATTYSPDRLKVLGTAFDEAWASIAGNFSEAAAKTARMSLATIILSLPRSEIDDAERIKTAALRVMAVGDRDGFPIEPTVSLVDPSSGWNKEA